MADAELRNALVELMERLETIAATHEELFDTDVREQMFDAVLRAFLRPQAGYGLPDEFGMFEADGNAAVREALGQYVMRATARASAIGLSDATGRLAAFQDDTAQTSSGQTPDAFFGWAEAI